MRKPLIRLLHDRKAEMEEAVFVYPVLLLLAFGLANLAMVGVAGMNAANAAHYGARLGSVAQANAPAVAASAAAQMINAAPVGSYAIDVGAGGRPGTLIQVQVLYAVPNYFAGLAGFFGVSLPATFRGTATSLFRQEGW